MQNKKVLILIVLAVGAVISLIYGITAPPKLKRKAISAVETIMPVRLDRARRKITPTERRASRTDYTAWARNPFAEKKLPAKGTVSASGTTYAYVTVNDTGGSLTGDGTLVANSTFTIDPYSEGSGYFTVEYINQGSNYVEAYLQSGDTTKLYFESPGNIGENVKMRVSFIPKVGTSSVAKFTTPDVVTKSRVYLFP